MDAPSSGGPCPPNPEFMLRPAALKFALNPFSLADCWSQFSLPQNGHKGISPPEIRECQEAPSQDPANAGAMTAPRLRMAQGATPGECSPASLERRNPASRPGQQPSTAPSSKRTSSRSRPQFHSKPRFHPPTLPPKPSASWPETPTCYPSGDTLHYWGAPCGALYICCPTPTPPSSPLKSLQVHLIDGTRAQRG